MNREEVFAEELKKLKEYAEEKGTPVTKEEVKEVFSRMDLDDEQLSMIMKYVEEKLQEEEEEKENAGSLNDEDSRYLSLYLEEIESLPKLTDGQKRALFMSAMNGEKVAKNDLIQGLLTQVADMAKLYANQGVPMEDLIGEGNVALAVSMDVIEQEEDPNEAEEMVAAMILKAMEELVNEDALSKDAFENWAVKANEVLEKAKELSEDLMRKVTIAEPCAETGMEEEFIKDVIEVTGGKIEFLDLGKES